MSSYIYLTQYQGMGWPGWMKEGSKWRDVILSVLQLLSCPRRAERIHLAVSACCCFLLSSAPRPASWVLAATTGACEESSQARPGQASAVSAVRSLNISDKGRPVCQYSPLLLMNQGFYLTDNPLSLYISLMNSDYLIYFINSGVP